MQPINADGTPAQAATGFQIWWIQHGRMTVAAALVAAYCFLPAKRKLTLKVGAVVLAYWAYGQARSKGWL